MIRKSIKEQISNGLEARPVAVLVQVASQYESAVYVELAKKRVNAKSIMGMMTLGLNEGDNVIISAEGTDEEAATQDDTGQMEHNEGLAQGCGGFCFYKEKNIEKNQKKYLTYSERFGRLRKLSGTKQTRQQRTLIIEQ